MTKTTHVPSETLAESMARASKMLSELDELEAMNPGVELLPLEYTPQELMSVLDLRMRRLKQFVAERDKAAK